MMSDPYSLLLGAMIVIAPIVFLTLFFISAPYGRHVRTGWGPSINSRIGWLVMEAPASLIMLAMFVFVPGEPAIWLLLAIWQVHYFHRAFIYPFTLRSDRQMPVVVMGMAIVFNAANAILNGWHFVLNSDWYTNNWFTSPNFVAGLLLFVVGYWITKRSDHILRELRAPGETDYRIPGGFLYRWISCPNYFGESLQWFGWALMTLSPAGWVFFLWTLANLLPRAISHHRWYRETFVDYPPERRAFIPGVL